MLDDPNRTYRRTTWYDPRAVVRLSPIHGMGMFARRRICQGEIVASLGGTLMTDDAFRNYIANVPRYNAVQVGEHAHLVDLLTKVRGMNHSCDANLWMRDEVTLVARREIAVGEELTQDYALYTTRAEWSIDPCMCGSPVCRRVVSGNDWRRPEIQERYRDHFSPFINDRIRRL